ncbi:MAG: hypothetical protein WD512_09240, partial [Candidatus Paceibacterota bacterium]
YITILFVLAVLTPNFAYAEVGRNYDTIKNPDGTVTWTSHPERIPDDSWNYKNYILKQDSQTITFESAKISFIFDKVGCDFGLYDSGRIVKNQLPVIESFSHSLKIDTIEKSFTECNIISYIENENGLDFSVSRNGFVIIYNLDFSSGLEWTFDFQNNEGKNSTVTITDTCLNCIPLGIDNNTIRFDGYVLDTKNELHNTVKDKFSDKGNFIINYEKTISGKERLIIDPIFSATDADNKRFSDDSNNGVCDTYSSTFQTTDNYYAGMVQSANAIDCIRVDLEFDISSTDPSWIVTDLELSVQTASSQDCGATCELLDIVSIDFQPSTRTAAQRFSSIGSGSEYRNDVNWS